MWPFMLLVSLAALVMGMLNAKHVFGPPAMASSYFNLGSIIAGVAIGYWIDPHFGARSLVGLAIGTLIGGAWQLIGQFPSLWKVGYRFHPDFHWRDEGVRTVLTLMGPAVIAASAVQVNVLINSGFAASLGNGPVSWLNIAFRLMQLPLGIFGVAIGTVTLPLVSKHAALGNTAEFRAILARGMRLAFLLTIPSAIGLAMLASPIISVIYQHGRFTAEMTRQTAGALQFYAIGLVAYAALKVLTPAFYAIGKRNTPMLVSFLAIGANLFLNWLFTFRLGWGHRGLAFSTSLVATINFLLLYALMRRHTRRLETRQMLIGLGKICVAGALLALICWAANYWWLDAWSDMRFFQKLVILLGDDCSWRRRHFSARRFFCASARCRTSLMFSGGRYAVYKGACVKRPANPRGKAFGMNGSNPALDRGPRSGRRRFRGRSISATSPPAKSCPVLQSRRDARSNFPRRPGWSRE